MAAFFLWCILFILCWPLALLALVLYHRVAPDAPIPHLGNGRSWRLRIATRHSFLASTALEGSTSRLQSGPSRPDGITFG
jgi:hypothetical protein